GGGEQDDRHVRRTDPRTLGAGHPRVSEEPLHSRNAQGIGGPPEGTFTGRAERPLTHLAKLVIAVEPSGSSLARQPAESGSVSLSRWDRKADPGVSPALGHDHGIDADRLASPIDQRAAAVARDDVRIRLDEAAVRLQFDLAIEGAHDAGGGRLIEAQGAADGHEWLAHLQRR